MLVKKKTTPKHHPSKIEQINSYDYLHVQSQNHPSNQQTIKYGDLLNHVVFTKYWKYYVE